MGASPSPLLPPDPDTKTPSMDRSGSQFSTRPPLPQLSNLETSSSPRHEADPHTVSERREPQPITDAVNDAFHNSSAQNQIDPELVRQVTEQVIKNLQHAMLGPDQFVPRSVSSQVSQDGSARSDASAQRHRPTTQSLSSVLPPRFTPPPSPDKSRPVRSPTSDRSSSSTLFKSEIAQQMTGLGVQFDGSNEGEQTPRSQHTAGSGASREDISRSIVSESPTSTRYSNTDTAEIGSFQDKTSKESTSDQDATSRRSPPKPVPAHMSRLDEPTTLEKVWGPLFTNGKPTVRLSQFLRGLAAHLINDYEPKGNLVVTPPKMLRFFTETRLPEENYPWETIFAKMPNPSLTIMYRKLLCQHHFVQMADHDLPSIPALTPRGFEAFFITLIQAHPEEEYERLSSAVMHMPISNADNRSERYPKELPRRLLPQQASIHAEQRLVSSLCHESQLVQLKGAQNIPPPPRSAPPMQPMFRERERKPYANIPQSNVFDDEDFDFPATSVQIERERKPYTTKGEGAGKNHDMDRERVQDRDRERERERNRPTPISYRSGNGGGDAQSRNASNIPTQSSFTDSSDPMDIPLNRHRKSFGQTTSNPPSFSGPASFAKGGRRSPPPRNSRGWSEFGNGTEIPGSQYSSNVPRGPPLGSRDSYANDVEDERRHSIRRPSERATTNGNPNDDGPLGGRGYPIPPRQPPSINPGLDPMYSTSAAPPVGSWHNGSMDHRRNTWVGTSPPVLPGGSGTDGYGSFNSTTHNSTARAPVLPGYPASNPGSGPSAPH